MGNVFVSDRFFTFEVLAAIWGGAVAVGIDRGVGEMGSGGANWGARVLALA